MVHEWVREQACFKQRAKHVLKPNEILDEFIWGSKISQLVIGDHIHLKPRHWTKEAKNTPDSWLTVASEAVTLCCCCGFVLFSDSSHNPLITNTKNYCCTGGTSVWPANICQRVAISHPALRGNAAARRSSEIRPIPFGCLIIAIAKPRRTYCGIRDWRGQPAFILLSLRVPAESLVGSLEQLECEVLGEVLMQHFEVGQCRGQKCKSKWVIIDNSAVRLFIFFSLHLINHWI